ncbi:hypothetical protein V2A60_003833 [Cordyceps javanica]
MEWWEPTLRDYLKHDDDSTRNIETIHVFGDYENFEDRILTAFGNPDEHKEATRQLTRLKQTGSAAHYAREFKRIEEVKDDIYRDDRPELFDNFVDQVIKADNRLQILRHNDTPPPHMVIM